MDFSIGKKEAKEKKTVKNRPQVDSNPSSTGREESIPPADPFYFVNSDYLPPPGDRLSKMTTSSRKQQQQRRRRRRYVEALAAAAKQTTAAVAAAAVAVRRSTRSSRSSRSCSSREGSISHDACRSPSSREEAPYVREHAHSRSKNSTTIIGSSSRQAQKQ